MVIVFFLLIVRCSTATLIAFLVARIAALTLSTTDSALVGLITESLIATKQIRQLVQICHRKQIINALSTW
jgi:hypothetical protein